ncbi:MAG: hypothetical protein AB8E15_02645 [Bdellovibrionales bacterium]
MIKLLGVFAVFGFVLFGYQNCGKEFDISQIERLSCSQSGVNCEALSCEISGCAIGSTCDANSGSCILNNSCNGVSCIPGFVCDANFGGLCVPDATDSCSNRCNSASETCQSGQCISNNSCVFNPCINSDESCQLVDGTLNQYQCQLIDNCPDGNCSKCDEVQCTDGLVCSEDTGACMDPDADKKLPISHIVNVSGSVADLSSGELVRLYVLKSQNGDTRPVKIDWFQSCESEGNSYGNQENWAGFEKSATSCSGVPECSGSECSCYSFTCDDIGSARAKAFIYYEKSQQENWAEVHRAKDFNFARADAQNLPVRNINVITENVLAGKSFIMEAELAPEVGTEGVAYTWRTDSSCVISAGTNTSRRVSVNHCPHEGDFEFEFSYSSDDYVGSTKKLVYVNKNTGSIGFPGSPSLKKALTTQDFDLNISMSGVNPHGAAMRVAIEVFGDAANHCITTAPAITANSSNFTAKINCSRLPEPVNSNTSQVGIKAVGYADNGNLNFNDDPVVFETTRTNFNLEKIGFNFSIKTPTESLLLAGQDIEIELDYFELPAGLTIDFSIKSEKLSVDSPPVADLDRVCSISKSSDSLAILNCSSTRWVEVEARVASSSPSYQGSRTRGFSVVDPVVKVGSVISEISSHPSASAYYNSFYNSFINHSCPVDKPVITGIISIHNDSREDRKYRFRCASAKIGEQPLTITGKTERKYTSRYSTSLNYGLCQSNGLNKVMVGHKSFDSGNDRDYTNVCANLSWGEKVIETYSCTASIFSAPFSNDYDRPVYFYCPAGKVVVAEGSQYNGRYRDRKFKYQCCSLRVKQQ